MRAERFDGATLLISPRMAVDRMMISDFCNGGNKKRVVESCQVSKRNQANCPSEILMQVVIRDRPLPARS